MTQWVMLLLACMAWTACGSRTAAASQSNVVVNANSRGGNGVSNGIPDEFTLIRHGATIEVYLNGTPSRSWPLLGLNTLTVDGSNDDDTLTVDFSGGTPIPPGGLHYNGGENGPAGDTLRLVGGTLDRVAYRFFNRTDGAIDIDGSTLVYTGLEPILDTVPATTLTVNGTNAPNAITVTQAGANGEVDVDNSEILQFANKTTLVIDALGGNDQIYVGPISAPGLTDIVIHGGPGDDVISVAAGAVVPLAIFGDDGDDLFRVAPSASAAITVHGGAHVIGDHLVVIAGTSKAKNTGTAVTVEGLMDVNYTAMEGVDIVRKNVKKFLP